MNVPKAIGLVSKALSELENGNNSSMYDTDFCQMMSVMTTQLLTDFNWGPNEIVLADAILRYSNIAYNCTDNEVLPLDDGLYDQLLEIYKKYNPNYQVGYKPSPIQQSNQSQYDSETDLKVMCVALTDEERDSKLFIEDILDQHTPISYAIDAQVMDLKRDPISKRLINTTHKYPELVGTLDKCKFVLNNDAVNAGVYDKPSVAIFERDFIQKCLQNGIIGVGEKFEMVSELKYDGVSVEAEVCGDRIVSALSRGDTGDNIATDLTPIFGGYKFPHAESVRKDVTFGIKFEAVITKYNLDKMSRLRGKSYKNCRNAIIGLLGSSDAFNFVQFITLIPLASSLELDRISELKFLNAYYNSGEYNRYVTMQGDYQQILFQVKQFTESAEMARSILPYMIDGVVISFTNPDKIKALGRVNSVNKYSMAIKFNPKKVRTIFLNYTYNIGKTGEVIPMVHFKPCEFIGAIHEKQTIHSYQRFKDLNLAKGDQIDVEYVNDVISYVTKPDNEFNRRNRNKPEEFIKICPFCGSEIFISPTGKSARCPNPDCHERKIMRMVDMMDKLGFKDFSESWVRTLDITSFRQLMTAFTFDNTRQYGELTASYFIQAIQDVKNTPIYDYRIMAAMNFGSIADETWKIILTKISIRDLLIQTPEWLKESIRGLHGIGPMTVNTVTEGAQYYKEDIECALSMLHIIESRSVPKKPRVAITGFRDEAFINLINGHGFDCSDSYSVTKNTVALIADSVESTSSKAQKARQYEIPIFTKDTFLRENGIQI